MPIKSQTFTRFSCALAVLSLLLIAAPSHAEWTSRALPFPNVPPTSQDDSVKANLRSGAEAMHTGKADQAEHYFREVTRIAPDLPDGYLDLGLAQLRQGKLPDAVASLQKALDLNQRVPGAHMFLGITYYQMGRFDDARTALQQEVDLNSGNAEALMWLGITELAAGHPEKAVAPLDKAAELAPKDINILDYRGRAHLLVSKNSYAQMYALDPNSWRMHRLSAQIYSEANQHKEAIREFEAAVKFSPKQADLYEELGDEYRKDNNLEMAAATYRQELELTPHNPVALYDLGSTFVEQGKSQSGVPLLREAIKILGGPSVADYYLGRGLADLGMYQEAADHLEKATKIIPQDEVAHRAYYKLAQVYRKLQRPADAQNAIGQFQKLTDQLSKQGAQQVADWRKMNASPAAESPVPLPTNP
jgi:tetratricopeptide (TPR) repeat protein